VLEDRTADRATARRAQADLIKHATWLSASCVLVATALEDGAEGPRVWLVDDAGESALESRFHLLASRAELDGWGEATSLFLVAVPGGRDRLARGATLAIESRGEKLSAGPLEPATTDLKTFVRRTIAPLEPPLRALALEFIASAMALGLDNEEHGLSETLFSVREALRERLPASVVSQSKHHGFHVDRLMAVDERGFYIEGWIYHEGTMSRITAVSPEGSRAELAGRLFHHPRPDVAEFFSLGPKRLQENLGFVCFFDLDAPSARPDGWMIELEDEWGVTSELAAPTVLAETLQVRDAILNDPYIEKLPDHHLMEEHIHPAISRIQDELGGATGIAEVIQYGTPPESPEVSIVVPLYLQLDHVEVQLAQFASDSEISEADLVYVLDSPQQAEELRNYAADLFPIYRIPFRLAVLERNAGFAGACNAGASLARARLLLLLNSDVLPDRPGWLGAMREFYDATPRIGALGPKLLYEDDSIQHAGMYFYNLPGSSVWVDAHYFKGMHRSLPAANVPRHVPVLSGACLMIDRELYSEFGGLQGAYVQGDYEDSDLCLQLSEKGYENWYTPDAELYHLEGQSYQPDARRPANRYNMWLHSHLWGERIAALMRDADLPAD
jgi:O-antigen biosynthesis protein